MPVSKFDSFEHIISFENSIKFSNVIFAIAFLFIGRIFFIHKINKGINDFRHQLGVELLQASLFGKLASTKGVNPAKFIATVLSEADNYITFLLQQVSFAMSYITVIIFLLIVAALIDYANTLYFVFFAVFGFAVFVVPTYVALLVFGNKRAASNEGRFRAANEIILNKEVISAFKVHRYFLDRFHKHSRVFNHALTYIMTLSMLPRVTIETLLFSTAVYFLFFMPQTGVDFFSQNALLVALVVKVLPHFQNTINCISKISLGADPQKRIEELYSIPIKDVNNEKTFEFQKHVVFNFIKVADEYSNLEFKNIRLEKGKVNVVKGPSGSGKTTLLRVLMGLVGVEACSYTSDSEKDSLEGHFRLSNNFSYVGQELRLISDTVLNNILVGRSPTPSNDELKNLLERAGFRKLEIDSLIGNLGNIVGDSFSLSGGQMQRLMLARALLYKPDTIFLDEFTSAVDADAARHLVETIVSLSAELNTTIVWVTHDTSLVPDGANIINFEVNE